MGVPGEQGERRALTETAPGCRILQINGDFLIPAAWEEADSAEISCWTQCLDHDNMLGFQIRTACVFRC